MTTNINTKDLQQKKWVACFQKQITSPAWTLPLAILAPIIFIWSNNWFMYSFQELSISLLTLLLVCSFVFAAGKLTYSRFKRMVNGRLKYLSCFMFCILFMSILLTLLELPLMGIFKNVSFTTALVIVDFIAVIFLYFIVLVFAAGKFVYPLLGSKVNKNTLWLLNFLVCVLLLGVLLVYFKLPLQGFSNSPFLWQIIFIATFLYFIVRKCGFGPIRVFLVLWLVMSIGTWLYSAIASALGGWIEPDESEHIAFKERPNIYLCVLESYHDLTTMREVYGIDTEPLQSLASSHDFFIYENVYSNSDYTLTSMVDIFGMQLNAAQAMGNNDIDPKGRKLIGGGSGNNVYRILKENNYHTAYLTTERPFYYFHTKGRYLDETDIYFGPVPGLRPLYDGLFPFFNNIYTYLGGRKSYEDGKINDLLPKFRNRLLDNIRTAIEESESKKPFFLGFKSGAAHASDWQQKDEWVSSGTYQELVKQGNQELSEVVDLIVDKDPSAVIILVGDHGSARLRGIWDDAVKGDIASLDKLLKQHGESLDTLASDTFGTFLAIRMPGKGDISNGLPMSHVNIFRHIFAELANSDDPDSKRAILEKRAPSESGMMPLGFVLVKDGIVQHPAKP